MFMNVWLCKGTNMTDKQGIVSGSFMLKNKYACQILNMCDFHFKTHRH